MLFDIFVLRKTQKTDKNQPHYPNITKMKNTLLKLLMVLVAVFAVHTSKASHNTGGTITYECIAPNQYKVVITLFRDCSGIPLALPPTITATNTCGASIDINIFPVAGTGAPIRAECDNEPTTCDGGTRYGVQKYQGFGFFTIPATTANNCQVWKFVHDDCCRNTNNTAPTGGAIHLETFMYNRVAGNPLFCNNSPTFAFPYIPAYCLNEPIVFNTGVTEVDGDSLAFALVPALTAAGVSIVYAPGLSPTQPVFVTSPLVIDSLGNIRFSTNVVQVGIFAIRIREYRAGQIICELTLDIQMQIDVGDFCDNITPTYKKDTLSVPCKSVLLPIKLNTPVACASISLNGSDFRVFDQSGFGLSVNNVVPISCTADDRTDSLHVFMFDSLVTNGVYYLYSKLGDDGNTMGNKCLKYQPEFDTLVVVVNDCPPPPPPYMYSQALRLVNVSVDSTNNAANFGQWSKPLGFDFQFFLRYGLQASVDPATTPFSLVTQVFDSTQLIAYDTAPLVPPTLGTYFYAVDMALNNGTPATPISNNLNTIYLQNTPASAPEDTLVSLVWNAYRGWLAPIYNVQYAKDQSPTTWIEAGNTPAQTFVLRKPNEEGNFITRVYTVEPVTKLKSYSNWIPFKFERKNLVIPDIFTPNSDGTNDKFVIQQLEYYPSTKLKIHDRWGKIIYESNDYRNDWGANTNSAGIYYYTLNTADGQEFNGSVKIVK